MNWVVRYPFRHNRDRMFVRSLTNQVAHPRHHSLCYYPFPILRHLDQINLQIKLRVCVQVIPFRASILHDSVLLLQGKVLSTEDPSLPVRRALRKLCFDYIDIQAP